MDISRRVCHTWCQNCDYLPSLRALCCSLAGTEFLSHQGLKAAELACVAVTYQDDIPQTVTHLSTTNFSQLYSPLHSVDVIWVDLCVWLSVGDRRLWFMPQQTGWPVLCGRVSRVNIRRWVEEVSAMWGQLCGWLHGSRHRYWWRCVQRVWCGCPQCFHFVLPESKQWMPQELLYKTHPGSWHSEPLFCECETYSVDLFFCIFF